MEADPFTVFLSVFTLVFIGELGDKTQIAAGTGILANHKNIWTIFLSSALALTAVAAITVYGAGLIPVSVVPTIRHIGGGLLVVYGIYLFYKATSSSPYETTEEGVGWRLFVSHFSIVFVAELGDKTQIATLAAALENESQLVVVFIAATLALVSVTGITVWGVTKIPKESVTSFGRLGAGLMVAYGVYMLAT